MPVKWPPNAQEAEHFELSTEHFPLFTPMPLTAEEVTAKLAPRCEHTTMEVLVKLYGMTFNRSDTAVPDSFFKWHPQDKRWLLDRNLIQANRTGQYIITATGKQTVLHLLAHLKALHP